MAKQTDEEFVWDQIQFTRMGAFSLVNEGRLKECMKPDASDWIRVASQALLAETYDQLGVYDSVESLANYQVGIAQLDLLKTELAHQSVTPPLDQTAARDLARARIMLVLQCAIASLRIADGRTRARDLLTQVIELISDLNKPAALEDQHIETLFFFWRGRTYSVEFDFEKAEKDFQKALDIADRVLKAKLPSPFFEPPASRHKLTKDQTVAAGNYVLSTCLAFGFGQYLQLKGELHESLQFLRVAVPLSRGSEDYHRRGYAHLLMGTAMRSQGRPEDSRMVEEHLNDAKRLLGGDDEDKTTNIPRHYLHLARVNHQMALHKYDQAPLAPTTSERITAYEAAQLLNERASEQSKHPSCINHRDPILMYGISVVRSLIKTALGDFDAGSRYAQEAIDQQEKVPPWIAGWSWLAKGRALSKIAIKSTHLTEIKAAETAFDQVLRLDPKKTRETDRTAAWLYLSLLYSNTGDIAKASIYFDRAAPYAKESEHRWLRDLEEEARSAAHIAAGYRDYLDLQDLLAEGRRQNPAAPWPWVKKEAEKKLLTLLFRMRDKDLSSPNGIHTVAHELGINKSTLYAKARALGLTETRQRSRRPIP